MLPAEAGLDRSAVDFHKGCYMGQEIVSRMEMAGRIRKELIGWYSPKIFADLKNATIRANDIEVGWITSQISKNGYTLGLAYARSSLIAQSEYQIGIDKNGITNFPITFF